MPDARSAEATMIGSGAGARLNPGARSAHAVHTLNRHSRNDLNFVRRRLARIAGLAGRGSHAEARGACADLLFDFQPLVAAYPDLIARCDDVLLRCGATALRSRFLLAVHGEAAASVMPKRQMSEPVPILARQEV